MFGLNDFFDRFNEGIQNVANQLNGLTTEKISNEKYGLKISNRLGNTIYASNEVTWNQVDSFIVAGGGSLFKSYPALVGREIIVVQSMINAPPLDRRAIAHTVLVKDTLITVSGGSEASLILVLMR